MEEFSSRVLVWVFSVYAENRFMELLGIDRIRGKVRIVKREVDPDGTVLFTLIAMPDALDALMFGLCNIQVQTDALEYDTVSKRCFY